VIFEEMRAAGIGVNLHYIPIPLQPYYQQLGHSTEGVPEAMRYYGEAISLPIYYEFSESDQDTVCNTLERVLLRYI
jgi:dTDP-4-amino-4,6-dideoxygalactose transaminase